MKTFALSMTLFWLIANATVAGEPCKAPGACTEVQTCGSPNCCGRCGSCGNCEKHCQIVCEMKEIKKTVWVVKCSDFCAPLPNRPHKCCGQCDGCSAGGQCTAEASCADCGDKKCDPCASDRKRCVVPPKCGKVREKKTLEKKEVVCKVPTYKCIVVYSCQGCNSDCGDAGVKKSPETAPVPPAPPLKTTQELQYPVQQTL